MTVICQNCQTDNRDKAMFCRGCAGKLPAFAATGPSALAALGGAPRSDRRSAQGPAPASGTRGRTSFSLPGVRWWFAAVLLLGATMIALLAWIAMAPERAPARTLPPDAMGNAPAPAQAAIASTTVLPPLTSEPMPARPAESAGLGVPTTAAAEPSPTVPFEAALSPGESQVAPQAAVPVTTPAPNATAAAPAPPTRNAAARNGVPTGAQAGGRADPRVGCERMFFAFAARCEANHCAQAAYSRHPRCAVVRQERLRDEARRNLSSGY